MNRTTLILTILLSLVSFPAIFVFGCEIDDIGDYTGYTIVSRHTVTGFINDDGEKESHYNGCSFGRVLIIDHNKQVTCLGYGYSYAYRPEMILLSSGSSLKACIEDDVFDVR